ncbi:MAG TPA: OPT family oligopeptide transporter [Kofleriaceae bacterium]|nr:OPT family oligopeptide transporter [Kofleriaceae bacterium]
MKPEATEDPEAVWLRDVYQPNATNLTVRAVIGGMLIGCVMCVSNIYVFFKTGWSMGVTITACILAFSVFGLVRSIGGKRVRELGMLENNALTTVASGAGYMTGGGNMAAWGALLMVTAVRPPQVPMVLWFAVIASLGVFAAIPIKRQLINKEGLAFPTGTATAETLRSIHGENLVPAGEPVPRAQVGRLPAETKTPSAAKALALAAAFGAAVGAIRDIAKWVKPAYSLPYTISGHPLVQWTLALKTEVILLGAGALMSFRTGWSVLLGGLLTYGVMGPSLLEQHLIKGVSYKAIVEWTVWPGAAILVGAGLTSFALDYKSLGRAFTGLSQIVRGRRERAEQGISAVEAPEWWFPAGFMALTPIIVFLMAYLFQIPIWAAILAVPLAVLMGFIAARVTGETDVTPTKALGPVTQMMYGAVTPGNLSGNIMAANVTGGVGLHAADLLTTLKTGWLLGAKPRHQLYAQLFGVLAGAFIVVPAFNLIIPDPAMLGTDDWPAPSCLIWAGVSKAFAGGIDNLGHEARVAIAVGLSLGVGLALLEKLAPKRMRAFVPSPYGLGIAMVVPGSNCISMFLGAAIAEVFRRRKRESIIVPVASGLIAGESLMGVLVALLVAGGVL